jgi:ribosome maturation factor RimP
MRAPSPRLQELIEPIVQGLGYELVGSEWLSRSGSSLVRLYIDREGGVTIDDCEKVSHQVSGALDVEDLVRGPYTLEVSSPGLDRPLFTPAQFTRFAGREAKIRTHVPVDGRRNFRGFIRGVDETRVVLEVDGAEVALAFEQIEKANLVPVFD